MTQENDNPIPSKDGKLLFTRWNNGWVVTSGTFPMHHLKDDGTYEELPIEHFRRFTHYPAEGGTRMIRFLKRLFRRKPGPL